MYKLFYMPPARSAGRLVAGAYKLLGSALLNNSARRNYLTGLSHYVAYNGIVSPHVKESKSFTLQNKGFLGIAENNLYK